MRFSNIIVAGSLTALGSATLQKREFFTPPVEGSDGGFSIPDDVNEGTWAVTIDDAGVAHHTRIDGAAAADLAALGIFDDANGTATATPARHPHGVAGGREGRRDGWDYDCGGGGTMQRDITDYATRGLADQCGNGKLFYSGTHIYTLGYGDAQRMAAFFCAYSGREHRCDREQIQGFFRSITSVCGLYKEGWTNYWQGSTQLNGVGYHIINRFNNFCNSDHPN